MIRIDTKQLSDGDPCRSATPAQIIPHLLFVQAIFDSEAHQSPALDPYLRFHPFRVEGH